MKGVTRDDLIRLMVGRTITNLFPKQDVEAGEVVLQVENLSRLGSSKMSALNCARARSWAWRGWLARAAPTWPAPFLAWSRPPPGGFQIEGKEVAHHLAAAGDWPGVGLRARRPPAAWPDPADAHHRQHQPAHAAGSTPATAG